MFLIIESMFVLLILYLILNLVYYFLTKIEGGEPTKNPFFFLAEVWRRADQKGGKK